MTPRTRPTLRKVIQSAAELLITPFNDHAVCRRRRRYWVVRTDINVAE